MSETGRIAEGAAPAVSEPAGGGQLDDSTVMDAGTLEAWLIDEARHLSAAMELRRVREERVDHLLGLLGTIQTPPARLLELVPEDVAQLKRRLIGLSRKPGFLDTTRGLATPAAVPNAAKPGEPRPIGGDRQLLELARAEIRSPQQSAVLEHVVASARDAQHPEQITVMGVSEALEEDGTGMHRETVRRALDHLCQAGVLRKAEPGRYELTSQAQEALMRRTGPSERKP